MDKDEIKNWLKESREDKLAELWSTADRVRRENVGDAVYLRGLVEFSNHCARRCGYCGINATNSQVSRYRMTADEILECARQAEEYGYCTVVLQSGEDYGMPAGWLADVIRRIKNRTGLAVTLSVGERSYDDLRLWKSAGADRYLLRFETSNRKLYDRIHPPLPHQQKSDRFEILRRLREIGYEVGSGVMIGIPGQTWDDIAEDIVMFSRLDLDMIGVGPYIPHPAGEVSGFAPAEPQMQVPNTEDVTYRVVALTRIMCPCTNIPSTTALATLNKNQGRELGLQRGANVVMPNVTPLKYRTLYEIYPEKACINETAQHCCRCLESRLASIGRTVGRGRGDSANFTRRTYHETV